MLRYDYYRDGTIALEAFKADQIEELARTLGRSFAAQVVSLGLALGAATVTYLVGCRALRVRELDTLTSVWARFRRT